MPPPTLFPLYTVVEYFGSIPRGPRGKKNKKDSATETLPTEDPPGHLSKALSLCIVYAANLGGTVTLNGTTCNMMLINHLNT